MHTEGQHFLWA